MEKHLFLGDEAIAQALSLIHIYLVCPAMFDLGESKKVVIVSTTEGDDKPLKYPHIFQEADKMCIRDRYLSYSM